MSIQGVIFDLDGTLVDSQLDFTAMRRDMGIGDNAPILETLQQMHGAERQRCQEILARHERLGVAQSQPFPGIIEMLQFISRQGLPMAIVTRNRREFALQMLQTIPFLFDPVIGREEGPIKPAPWALLEIIEQWDLTPSEVAMVGDYQFDLEAGRRAGCCTIWFAHQRTPGSSDWHALADHIIADTRQARECIQHLIQEN